MERNVRVAEAAEKAVKEHGGQFEIRLRKPTGKIVKNVLGVEEIEFEESGYETKSYQFRTMATNDWNMLLKTRAELNNEMVKTIDQADNVKINDLTTRIYEFLALKLLGMKHDDYIRAEWDSVKLAVDAATFIIESGVELDKVRKWENAAFVSPSRLSTNLDVKLDEETLRLNKRTLPGPVRTEGYRPHEEKEKEKNSSSKKYYDSDY